MDIKPLGSGAQTGAGTAQVAPVQTLHSSPAQASDSSAVSQAVAGEPSVGQVQQAVQKINTNLAAQSQGIEFSIDSSSHRIVVKVVDQSNNEVIRQIPSKEALAIADSIDENQGGQSSQGMLIKQQA